MKKCHEVPFKCDLHPVKEKNCELEVTIHDLLWDKANVLLSIIHFGLFKITSLFPRTWKPQKIKKKWAFKDQKLKRKTSSFFNIIIK